MSDATSLLQLQDIDLEVMRSKKQLEELPEKEMILECRRKSNEICKKRAQVVDMADDVDEAVERFQKEDADLIGHLKEAQSKLDGTSDYRETSHVTKEMEGLVKRREKVEYELSQLSERSGKIEIMQSQIAAALDKLDRQEQELTERYRRKGHDLAVRINELETSRSAVVAGMDTALVERYEKLRKAKGGIAAARLEGRICSACHVEYQEGQLSRVRAEAPIAVCPICNRLLVVEER